MHALIEGNVWIAACSRVLVSRGGASALQGPSHPYKPLQRLTRTFETSYEALISALQGPRDPSKALALQEP